MRELGSFVRFSGLRRKRRWWICAPDSERYALFYYAAAEERGFRDGVDEDAPLGNVRT